MSFLSVTEIQLTERVGKTEPSQELAKNTIPRNTWNHSKLYCAKACQQQSLAMGHSASGQWYLKLSLPLGCPWDSSGLCWSYALVLEILKQCLTLVVASRGTQWWITEDSELWVTNVPQHPAVKLIPALERKAPPLWAVLWRTALFGLFIFLSFRDEDRIA